jgi:para-nitrobenzyl esterase
MERMRTRVLSLLCTLAVSACSAVPAHPAQPGRPIGPAVVLDSGPVRGAVDGDVVRYRGIPYARPPVGPLRWSPPQPPEPWTSERAATTRGPACPQTGSSPAESSVDEDCLHLDVTVPHRAATTARPVTVWIHGGGFTTGNGSDTDPHRLATRGDVIVVTVEFRLGVFANAALPGMDGGGGNFGQLDQQAALRWVRRNAHVFGGDPHNVTLFGESGGSIAVCGQLTSPGSAGLFTKAIMQSGSCGTTLLANAGAPGSPALPFWRPLRQSQTVTTTAATKLGCPSGAADLSCLRRQPVSALLKLTTMFAPAAVGSTILPRPPADALRAGQFLPVPVLAGVNRQEALLFAGVFALLGKPITAAGVGSLFDQAFGPDAPAVRARYPLSAYPTPSHAWAAAYTDTMFACPQASANDALARRTPVYGYEFADETAPPWIPVPPGTPTGASHAAELPYLFENKDKPITLDGRPLPLTAKQLAVGADMVRAWAAFAHTGTPSSDAKSWPRWSATSSTVHVFTEQPGRRDTVDLTASHRCS